MHQNTNEATSVAFQAAVKLRKMALAKEDGAFLGSEEELLNALGVSRPTFRQAARLLAHEQVLNIKRGVGGGFFARRPTLQTVSRAVAAYLNARHTSVEDVLEASAGVFRMGIGLAAESANEAARSRLTMLRNKLVDLDGQNHPAAELMLVEAELEQTIGELSGNPAIELCLTMFNQFGAEQSTVKLYAGHPERVELWKEKTIGGISALLAQDRAAALERFIERSEMLKDWVAADMQHIAADFRSMVGR